jgi:hypothetical protein
MHWRLRIIRTIQETPGRLGVAAVGQECRPALSQYLKSFANLIIGRGGPLQAFDIKQFIGSFRLSSTLLRKHGRLG